MNPQKLSTLAIQKIRRTMECGMKGKLDKDFIHYMKYLLLCRGNQILQMEAAWIFTNIAASTSEHTKFIVDSGVVPLLIDLLSSSSMMIIEQALWALGNICGDNTEYRNFVLKHGALKHLLSSIHDGMSESFYHTAAWVCVNIVRSRDFPTPFEIASEMVPKLCYLVKQDYGTAIDALWAMTFISDLGEDYIELFIDEDIIGRVVRLLATNNGKVQMAAMRFLGNVAVGSDDQTQELIDNDILAFISIALSNPNGNLRRTALWCLSNITIGTEEHACEVFDAGLLSAIIANLRCSDDTIVKEAVLTIRNLINFGTNEQMMDIIDNRAFSQLIKFMKSNDPEIAKTSLEAITILHKKSGLLIEENSRKFTKEKDDQENQ